MTEKKQTTRNLVIVLLVLILGALCFLVVRTFLQKEDQPEEETLSSPKLAYAEGTTVVRDGNALQDAVDKMAQKIEEGNMVLEYETEATSSNGQDFVGYLANASENSYDMYFDIYADEKMTDEIFLSGLVPPGSAIENIKLNRKLERGNHSVYLVFTTVEEDHETMHGQVAVKITLKVQ